MYLGVPLTSQVGQGSYRLTFANTGNVLDVISLVNGMTLNLNGEVVKISNAVLSTDKTTLTVNLDVLQEDSNFNLSVVIFGVVTALGLTGAQLNLQKIEVQVSDTLIGGAAIFGVLIIGTILYFYFRHRK